MVNKITLEAGQMFGFPIHQLTPPYQPSGYLGVCQVIRVQANGAVLAGLEWSGGQMPAVEQIASSPVLRLTQCPFQGEAAIYWQAEDPPEGFEDLGLATPSAEGIALSTCHCTGRSCRCKRFLGGWHACRASLTREWRWRRDPRGYEADIAWLRALSKKSHQEREQHRKDELAQVTLKSFSEETFFPGWEQHLKPGIVEASREIVRDALDKLSALDHTATASEKIEVLRWCVEAFNRLNVQYDHFITDLEREAICWHVERLAQAAGLNEPDLVDRWRDW